MTFLNAIMLFGLIGVSIPIIIHILNRRRARMVEWGAMQFLEASLASRNRRILIEEIILMAIRCCLLAALAFALARPFLTAGPLLPGRGGDAQDLAIVIDGSLSMTLESDGVSNFQRAINEAHQLVQVCRSADAVSVVLAGPVAQPVLPVPISDREEVHETLDTLGPTGGSMRLLEALNAAMETLSAGTNPAKRIVLITDGQGIGWDLNASKRWKFLSEAAEALPTRPIIIVRTFAAPEKWRNASARDLCFSRAVIGTDRSAGITVTIANTGEGSLVPDAVELSIDGKMVEHRSVGAIAEGSSGSIAFEHRFDVPGPHIVSARLICDDDLPGDNEIVRVVNVLRALPVLIVEGTSSSPSREGDGDFLSLAFDPDGSNGPPDKANNPVPSDCLVRPAVVSAADVASVIGFADYAVVVLANVPRLPASTAKELTDFVAGGGGLLIAPGEKSDRNFYNNWLAGDGKRLIGCRLVKVRTAPQADDAREGATHISPKTINHPALALLADPSESNLSAARVVRHWVLATDNNEQAVTVGASLACGDAYLVQRRLDKGLVLTLPVPMNADFSDLPRHPCGCFVPMAHELVYYLSAPAQPEMNLTPGEQFVYTLPGDVPGGTLGESAASPDVHRDVPAGMAEVAGPDGRRTAVRLRKTAQHWQANYSLTAQPGLYRMILPEGRGGKPATRPAGAKGVPFVVVSNPDESKLEMLSGDDYRRAGSRYTSGQLTRAETLGELTAAITGGVLGSEIWQYVAVAILVLLAAEIVTTRIIAAKRKMHLAEPVTFGSGRIDAERFRTAASKAAPPQPRSTEEIYT